MPRIVLLPLVSLLIFPSIGLTYPNSFPPVPSNPADRMTAMPIEDYRYDRSRHCVKHPTRGARALERWLVENVRGESWGIMRCAKLGPRNYSLHAEGRAIDWHLEIGDPQDRAAARQLVSLLLATDRQGNPHALARRMGVQELIWDCRIWWSGLEGMTRYAECYGKNGQPRKRVDPSNAHRNHVHIGLNHDGARMRTSFWRQPR
jgi:hypothetical protein